ncbi:MAG: PilZ domain-containing protein [Vicinamibacteria bacterium]
MASSTTRRVDFKDGIPVGVRSFLMSGRGKLLNLSSSGAYVATPMVLLPQARVKLQIILREEKRWVETDAIVVWENRGTVGRRDGLPPGYGFRFIDVSQAMERAIEKLLRAPAPQVESVPGPGVPDPAPASRSVPSESAPSPSPPGSQTMRFETPPVPMMHEDEPEGPPYRLRKDVVRRQVAAAAPGIFVLSYDRTQETRVGRSDESLRLTIAGFEGEYAYFYFEVIESAEERFYRECELFHRLGGDRGQLDNTSHPEPPESVSPECPVCVAAKTR